MDGSHQARGIYGQLIYIDHKRGLVVTKLSSWPQPLNDAYADSTDRAIMVIGRELSGR